jgi:beta-exotoxin I transport system permease protein
VRADIVRLDISGRLRSLIGYSLGMALYTLVVVAIYPAFEHSNSLDNLVRNDATAAALFGISGKISSTGGWLDANIYANFFPLLMLLLTVGYGAASLAGQDEDGTLGLLVTLPIRRAVIVGQKIGAMVAQAATLAVAVAVFVLLGRWFHLSVTLGDVLSISAAVLIMGLDFGILAMAIGALTGKRGTAIGVATTLAAASYLVSSLAPVASWIRPARYASLFYWSVGNNQTTGGVSLADFAVLVFVGAVVTCFAVLAFRRLDVR